MEAATQKQQHLEVGTTLHCQACVDKVAPLLDSSEQIDQWAVDLEASPRRLSVKGSDISTQAVDDLLRQAGYQVVDPHANSNNEPSHSAADQGGFWSDSNKWKRAGFNTLNCLIGCSIGDFGMLIYLQAYYPETSMGLQMFLAIIAGLTTSVALETVIMRVREKFAWGAALRTALGMSFISMVGMEIAMNATDFMVTGGQANFNSFAYWGAFGLAAIAGFLAPLPYNYWRLKKYNAACH